MAAPRIARNLTKPEAAYLAGLVDGEGTVTLVRKHRNENRQLSLSISSTEINILQWVMEKTTVGKITCKRSMNPQHAKSYAYAVYNRQALAILQQISGYLLSYKRRRTEVILSDYLALTPRNGKYSAECLRRRKAFEAKVLAIRPYR